MIALLSLTLIFNVLQAITPSINQTASANARTPTLGVTSNLFAHYKAEDFNTSTRVWSDSSGNGRHTSASDVRGTITKTTSSVGNGSTLSFPILQGSTNDGLRFPESVLPANYTLFHLARFNGSEGRIFTGISGNWLSGFWSGNAGVAFHDAWITETVDVHGTNWVLTSDQRDLYRSNGVSRHNTTVGTSSVRLGINFGYLGTEYSDWQVAEVIVYNRVLNESEIREVEGYLSFRYGISSTTDSDPVYTDHYGLNGDIVGDISGGGWATRTCPAGQVAVGFSAVAGTGTGISQLSLQCQAISSSGILTGGVTPTAGSFGVGAGTATTINCSSRALTGFTLYQGSSWGYSPYGNSHAFFVGGLEGRCGTLPAGLNSTTTSKVGPSATSFTRASQCQSGAFVVGITGKVGSVVNSVSVICAYVLGFSGTPAFSAANGMRPTQTASYNSSSISYSPRLSAPSLQWQSSATSSGTLSGIAGETGANFYISSNQIRRFVALTVTIGNYATTYSATSTRSEVIGYPVNQALPIISGTLTVGETLTATTGSWSETPTSYSYQWQWSSSSGGTFVNIAGATSATYRLSSSELSDYIRVIVTATNSLDSTAATSAVTTVIRARASTPVISAGPSDTATTVTISTSFNVTATSPDGGTLTYQWQQSTDSGATYSDLPGATSNSHSISTPAITAHGNRFRVVIGNTKNDTTESTTSTVAVLTVNPALQLSGGSSIQTTYGLSASSEAIASTGGTGSVTYSLSSSLTGVNINPNTGVVSLDGTTPVGTRSRTITATDAVGYSVTQAISITVAEGISIVTVTISSTPRKSGTHTITATLNTPGTVTFLANNRKILGCNAVASTGSNPPRATCSWRAKQHGTNTISATLTPTDSSYGSKTGTLITQVLRRISPR